MLKGLDSSIAVSRHGISATCQASDTRWVL